MGRAMTAERPIPEREKLPKESAAPDTRGEGDGDDDRVARRGGVHTAFWARDPCAAIAVGMIPPDSGRCYAVTFPMRDDTRRDGGLQRVGDLRQ